LLFIWNTVNPYSCLFGQGNRKEICCECGYRKLEKAKAIL
jgi:hypothetical protein